MNKLSLIRGPQSPELTRRLTREHERRLARLKHSMGASYIGHPSRHIKRLPEPANIPASEGVKYTPPTPWISRQRWT